MVDAAGTSGWSHLREVVLAMLLEASEASSDAPLYASYALYTLRLMEAALPDGVQFRLITLLEQASTVMQPPMAAPAIGLPWLLSLRPLPLPSAQVPHKREASGAGSGGGAQASTPAAIFQFSPFEARRRREASEREAARVRWVIGERVTAIARLSNPLCAPLRIDSLALHASVRCGDEGNTTSATAHFMPFSVSLTIPARCTGLDIELSGCVVVSGGVGTTNAAASAEMASSSVDHHLELHGVESRAYGAVCVHPIDAMGSVALLPASAYTVRSNRGMFSSQQSSSSNGMSVFHDAENQTVVHETDDQTDGGQCWQPPPALSIPLAPPMPLLVPAMSGMVLVGGGGSGGLHPGEVATLLVELSNSGQLPAATIDAQLLRPASGVRLTRGTGFTWYEISSPRHSLFDEAEMGEAACGRSRLELQSPPSSRSCPFRPRAPYVCRYVSLRVATARAPVILSSSMLLPLPTRRRRRSGPAAEAAMEDAAGGGGPPPVTPHPRLRQSDSNWSRQLSMPLRVQIADGLKLSSEIIVQSDPQRLYARKHGARVDDEEEPPGCLLMLHVDNTHKSATFELSCTLGAAVTNGNATQKDDDDGVLKWTFTPSSTRKLLLPLCCIDTTNEPTNHPLPESHAMLESYLEQRRPALTPSEADALRRAHRV